MPDTSRDQTTSVNISSNSLFHFTNSFDNLISILTHDFHPHLCLELIQREDTEIAFAIPMVSFCDLPLFLIKRHLKRYGNYGIGLKKTWGMKKGITPVFYVHRDSPPLLLWKDIGKKRWSKEVEDNLAKEIFDAQVLYYNHLKQYEGKEYRNGKHGTEDIRFYDEREWRYVAHLMYSSSIFQRPTVLERSNRKIWDDYKIEFTPDDVQFIIVKHENEIFTMKQRLDPIKMPKYSREQVDVLGTRIISSERIIEDI